MTTNTFDVTKKYDKKWLRKSQRHEQRLLKELRKKDIHKRLKELAVNNEKLTVNLNGYNGYGQEFAEEVFGGLVLEDNWTEEQLRSNLVIKHDKYPSFVALAWNKVHKAQEQKNQSSSG